MLEINETYPKQTLRNRCYILGANGPQRLSVPVKKPHGNHTKTSDIIIDPTLPWAMQHERAIASAYRRTPYYMHYEAELAGFFRKQHSSLSDLCHEGLALCLRMLRTDKTWDYTKQFSPHSRNLALHFPFETTNQPAKIFPAYFQAFSDRLGFVPNLSVLDAIFNLGPTETMLYLRRLAAEIGKTFPAYSG